MTTKNAEALPCPLPGCSLGIKGSAAARGLRKQPAIQDAMLLRGGGTHRAGEPAQALVLELRRGCPGTGFSNT